MQFPLNRTLIYLTLSDVFNWGIFYILTPIAGIYLARKLGADAVEIVGIGTSLYLLVRAFSQIPIGRFLDRLRGNRDEALVLFVGNILMGLPYIFYPFIESPSTYFALQFIFGLGAALNLVSWRKLFAKNLNKDKEGSQYATYELIMSSLAAVFSVTAGLIANINDYFFDLVMIVIGMVMMSGGIWALLVLKQSQKA